MSSKYLLSIKQSNDRNTLRTCWSGDTCSLHSVLGNKDGMAAGVSAIVNSKAIQKSIIYPMQDFTRIVKKITKMNVVTCRHDLA